MTIQTEIKADNGVNIEALIGARRAFAEAPEAAQFTFRSQCSGIEGTYNANRIGGYFGLGQEHERQRSFVIESDHPKVFAAADGAPTPTELVLAALASCLTGGVAAVAQHRNIQLNAVEATVRGTSMCRASSGWTRRSATAFRRSGCRSRSTPTPAAQRSKRWSPSRRSARRCSTS